MDYSILATRVSVTVVKVAQLYFLALTTKVVNIIVILSGLYLTTHDMVAMQSKINAGSSEKDLSARGKEELMLLGSSAFRNAAVPDVSRA